MRPVFLAWVLSAAAACLDAPPSAVPPSGLVDTGTGRDGPLATDGATRLDDASAALIEPASAGAVALVLSSADGLAVGDEVLVLQMTGAGAGHHESAIVEAVDGDTVRIDRALASAYPAGGGNQTQVVRIPHFTDVTVQAGGVLGALPWDPERGTGGVVS
ncbi:MAG TPA: hypothetical protein VFU21_12525, partial [Kofleriaceae bacterium]|nr:hypothetical protein [Kofleriaceae bacterium]